MQREPPTATLRTITPQDAAPREVIGIIGVGLMGIAVAERLLAGGFGVIGFDRNPKCLAVLREKGGTTAASARDLTGRCRRLFLSLPTSAIVSAILDEILEQLRADHVLLDTTTGSPEAAEVAANRAAAKGTAYLDATISGSSEQVRSGTVVVMAGGPEPAFTRCRDLFECFAERVFYLGRAGSGSKMKLTSNLVLGLNRAALAEGLVFAKSLELDPDRTLRVLRESMAYSRIMDTKGPKMVSGDFTPQARLSQHLKDVRLILGLGAARRLDLPLSRAHRELLERAEAAGLGDLDNSAVIRGLAPATDSPGTTDE